MFRNGKRGYRVSFVFFFPKYFWSLVFCCAALFSCFYLTALTSPMVITVVHFKKLFFYILNWKVTWNLFHLMDRSLLILKRIRLTCTKFSKNNSSCSIENDLIHLVKRSRFHVPQKVLFILHIRGDTLTALLKILNNPCCFWNCPRTSHGCHLMGLYLKLNGWG